MKVPQYQKDLSLSSPILLDKDYKKAKVMKMLAIIAEVQVLDSSAETLAIDVGCSGGLFASALASRFTSVVGIDIDPHAIAVANNENPADNLTYLLADSQQLPFPDKSVDLIVCNHVYEHVPDAAVLFDEIWRVLKPSGVCYLGAASRLIPIEPHYHLPLLSWLPKSLAHRYMRITGKGDYYYEKLRTYWGIRGLISEFDVVDYTLKVIEDPDRYAARDMIPKGGFLDMIPLTFWRLLYPLLPSYLLILRRPTREPGS